MNFNSNVVVSDTDIGRYLTSLLLGTVGRETSDNYLLSMLGIRCVVDHDVRRQNRRHAYGLQLHH